MFTNFEELKSNEIKMIDIVELIKNDNEVENNTPRICMIEGPWGIGKTYYVEHHIHPKMKRCFKNIVKISLFGIKSKEEIKNQIIDEYITKKSKRINIVLFIILLAMLIYAVLYIFKTKSIVNLQIPINLSDDSIFILFTYNHLRKIMSFLFDCFCIFLLFLTMKIYPIKNIILALHNKYLGSGLSFNKVNVNNLFESKNTLFIFDDLERISDTADVREILGFINELRENEGFNIIIIANEEELNRNYDKYLYYKEKMCIDKYNMTYNPEIYEQLTKTDNVELKNLYDRLVKPTCTISIDSLTGQTNNLRIIILFINIVKKVYNKLKKDNVSIIEKDINSILNVDKNNKFCTYSMLDSLLNKFKQYIKHIDDLKESLYNNKETNDIPPENIEIIKACEYEEGGEDLSIITDKYIEENFEKTKLNSILDTSLYFSTITNHSQVIKEIINCEDQISSFNDLRLILTFFVNCGDKYSDENEEWLTKISDIWFKKGTAYDLARIYSNIDPKINSDIIDNKFIKFIKSDDILPWFINELHNEYSFDSLTIIFTMILNHNPDVLLKIDFNKYQTFIYYVFENISQDNINNIQILKQIRDSLAPDFQKILKGDILKNLK